MSGFEPGTSVIAAYWAQKFVMLQKDFFKDWKRLMKLGRNETQGIDELLERRG